MAASPAKSWSVIDTNATNGPRTHGPIGADQMKYTLNSATPTPMPQAHAVIFLRDPSFVVLDEAGQRVSPMAQQGVSQAGAARPRLDPGQVIANLDELTAAALAVRCQGYPDGRAFKPSSKRETMIAFLARKDSVAREAAADDDDEIEVGEVTTTVGEDAGPSDLMGG